MRRIALFVVLALAACASDPLAAFRYEGPQAPQTAGSQALAPAAAIEAMVAGNTLVGVTRDGNRWARHLRPGGTYAAYSFPSAPPATGRQWNFTRGVWRADDGRLCFRPEEGRQENCFRIVAGPGVLHAYTEKDGVWQFSAEARSGNPFEL